MNNETWDPAWGAGNSAFQTAAKDLAAHRVRPFAALRACPEWNEGVTMLGHLGCCPFPASNGSILLIGKTAGIFNARHPPVLKQENSEVRTVEPDHLMVMESIKCISYLAQVSMDELHSHCPLANT